VQVRQPAATLSHLFVRKIQIAKMIEHARATLERLPDFGAQTFDLPLGAFQLGGFRLQRPEQFLHSRGLGFVGMRRHKRVEQIVNQSLGLGFVVGRITEPWFA